MIPKNTIMPRGVRNLNNHITSTRPTDVMTQPLSNGQMVAQRDPSGGRL